MIQKAYPILMYHSIADVPKNTIMRSLHVSPKRFILQMRLLQLIGYRAVSISELQHYLKGNKIGKVVGLIFDDGYRNNLINALPILKNPRNAIELAKKIDLLYENTEYRDKIAKNGFEKSKTISWENTLSTTLKVYNSIAN
jgi:glycosyltransferase involved in cell wall biosynthesis